MSGVLIALTIIGVIAALAVPALMQRTNKQEYVSALKKAYSTLSQAANMIAAEEGLPGGEESWTASDLKAFETFKKYLNNVKECKSGTNGCWPQSVKLLRSNKIHFTANNNNVLVLADGVQVMFFGHFDSYGKTCNINLGDNVYACGGIAVDINGVKGPNISGRDNFFFYILKNGSLMPDRCVNTAYYDAYCKGSKDVNGHL